MTYEPPTDFDEFLAAYENDDNDWWRAPCGQHQNLFEEAVDRWRVAQHEIDKLRKRAAFALKELDRGAVIDAGDTIASIADPRSSP